MVSLTFSLSDKIFSLIGRFSWINWSEIAREKLNKERIFKGYFKKGELSEEDWEFCEKMDWHPVDELPLKKEFVKELKERKKGPFLKFNSAKEIFTE